MSNTEENMVGPVSTQNIDYQIGQKVRFHRENRAMSVADLSNRVGMKKGAFHKLETGLTRWRVALLLECAEALNVSFLELLPTEVAYDALQSSDASTEQLSLKVQHPDVAHMADRLSSLSTNSFRAIEMLVAHFEEIDSSN